MAKEYIEREAVLRHRRKMSGADFGGEFWDEAVLCEDIRKIPTADVAEVRHAAKADSTISKTGLMCTACHSDVDRDAVWCKYCGAKIDEKDDEGK